MCQPSDGFKAASRAYHEVSFLRSFCPWEGWPAPWEQGPIQGVGSHTRALVRAPSPHCPTEETEKGSILPEATQHTRLFWPYPLWSWDGHQSSFILERLVENSSSMASAVNKLSLGPSWVSFGPLWTHHYPFPQSPVLHLKNGKRTHPLLCDKTEASVEVGPGPSWIRVR